MSHPLLFPLLQCCIMDVWDHLHSQLMCCYPLPLPLNCQLYQLNKDWQLRNQPRGLERHHSFPCSLSLSKSLYILFFNIVFLLPSLNHHYNPWWKPNMLLEKNTHIFLHLKPVENPYWLLNPWLFLKNLFKLWGSLLWAVF